MDLIALYVLKTFYPATGISRIMPMFIFKDSTRANSYKVTQCYYHSNRATNIYVFTETDRSLERILDGCELVWSIDD